MGLTGVSSKIVLSQDECVQAMESRRSDNLWNLLLNLFRHISPLRQKQCIGLLSLTLISSVAEVVSLGVVVPFIGILTQPEKIYSHSFISRWAQKFGILSAADLMMPIIVAFILAAIIAGILRLLLQWISIRLANETGADLSVEVYRRTLHQPYKVHVARSSSEIISGITQKVDATTSVLTSVVTVITSAALFIAILITLLVIDPIVASIALASFGGSYALIGIKTRQRLKQNSQCIAEQQTNVVKSLQEGLGAIRDVLLDGTQNVYCADYKQAVQQLRRATGENQYITLGPRYVMESLGMVLIALIAYVLSHRPGGIGEAFPILGALALAAQRLLPLLQQVYGNWSVVAGSRASLTDVLALLEQPLPNDANKPTSEALTFKEAITFENVGFRYADNSPLVLNDINLIISKGCRIGFMGSTGSGKSTTLDLLMALLEPTYGRILVDGEPIIGAARRAWQHTIAHVPQAIYLADASIAENIAFGVPPDQIDFERVQQAARQAQIATFIEERAGGYNARVGERGVRLSGGQRQRIGIARALYKQATVLIFDEATSALDTETEQMVMEAIEGLRQDLTILIIAHRLTTLRNCNQIVELESGRILRVGTYQSLVQSDVAIKEIISV